MAKIFDSHPLVAYRHEPDIAVGDCGLPRICSAADIERLRCAARDFTTTLLADRSLRSLGKSPVFRKAYDSVWHHKARVLCVYTLRLMQSVMPRGLGRGLTVPRFVDPQGSPPHNVVKTVRGLGRLGLLRQALPEARIVLIIRNPFGQIASRLSGIARGKFENNNRGAAWFDEQWLRTPQAARYDLSSDRISGMTLAEQLAWEWVISNEKAMDDASSDRRVRLIRLLDLIGDPVGQAKSLFAFAGLPWCAETEAFLASSSAFEGTDRFYGVYKQSRIILDKWRSTLGAEEQQQIAAIVGRSRAYRLWPDPEVLSDAA